MLKKLIPLCLLALAACTNNPIPAHMMEPREQSFKQVDGNYYLKGKLAIGDVIRSLEWQEDDPFFNNLPFALQRGFNAAGLLNQNASDAEYHLLSDIKDFQMPSCMFGSCETGCAVEYTLVEAKSGDPVYRELVVVPHTSEYPLFGANSTMVIYEAAGGAFGENIAHIAQSLARKTEADIR
ncbi:hypothetical protein [Tautonia marina]|uniref:hypothetical protein n=1 Tax=Tautonia marina TaxID=2653855 RepID=UPI001260D48E|nr:hypothetical protein [Tautonia marina]